jgi:hypothetical protein
MLQRRAQTRLHGADADTVLLGQRAHADAPLLVGIAASVGAALTEPPLVTRSSCVGVIALIS